MVVVVVVGVGVGVGVGVSPSSLHPNLGVEGSGPRVAYIGAVKVSSYRPTFEGLRGRRVLRRSGGPKRLISIGQGSRVDYRRFKNIQFFHFLRRPGDPSAGVYGGRGVSRVATCMRPGL